jgi:hypothetical protein
MQRLPVFSPSKAVRNFLVIHTAERPARALSLPVPVRRPANPRKLQAVRKNSLYSNHLSAKCQEWIEFDNFK